MISSSCTFYKYWGKAHKSENSAYHLLPYHCLDVAAVGLELLQQHSGLRKTLTGILGMDEESCLRLVAFFLACHDVGKFSSGFQNLRPDIVKNLGGRSSNRQNRQRHDTLGYVLWLDYLRPALMRHGWLSSEERPDARRWQAIFDQWSQTTTGHHGKPPENDGYRSADEYFDHHDIHAAEEFFQLVIQLFLTEIPGRDMSPRQVIERIKRCSWLLAGMSVLCDWIGSNDRYFPYECQERNLADYLNDSRKKAITGLRETGVLPSSVAPYSGMRSLFNKIVALSPLQAHLEAVTIPKEPQLWILEDLTGSGKTEAAVILAHRIMSEGLADGFFFALPTMATANAMYDRIGKAYRRLYHTTAKPSLILSHSAKNLSDHFQKAIRSTSSQSWDSYREGEENAEAVCSAWLADSSKKAFLADVGVGTIDQALVSVLPVKHQSLRLLGLARKVIIVDEVHAYDPYMHSLLKALLSFHAAMGGSAILLSATLPRLIREQLVVAFATGLGEESSVTLRRDAYPLVTRFSRASLSESSLSLADNSHRVIRVELLHERDSVHRLVLENAKNGRCVCWIRNTVADAMQAYAELSRSGHPEAKLLLFHARFAMGDRIEREEQVLEAFGPASSPECRAGKILIATQVVEQSLDLDFDVMITDLAPIDLIIQRAGRLRRHLRDREGNRLPLGSNSDGRGEPVLYVYSPDPVDCPSSTWYSSLFEKAAYVYEDHGRLWLTARVLNREKSLRSSQNARLLIEGVYGKGAEPIPSGLARSANAAEGKRRAKSSLGRMNALNLEEGYVDTMGQWIDDADTPTRLGDVSVRVRLAKWDGSSLKPWSDDSKHSWEMSEVAVRETLVKYGPEHLDKVLYESVKSVTKAMPDNGKWSTLIPLTLLHGDTWIGSAVNKEGEHVSLLYSKRLGLTKSE